MQVLARGLAPRLRLSVWLALGLGLGLRAAAELGAHGQARLHRHEPEPRPPGRPPTTLPIEQTPAALRRALEVHIDGRASVPWVNR